MTETVQLRRFVSEACDGPFGSAIKSNHYADDGARVVRLGNIGSAEWRGDDAAFLALDYFAELRRHSVEPGDLLIAGLGDERNAVGRAAVAPAGLGPALVKADCYRLRLRGAHPQFIAYCLSSSFGQAQSAQLADGSTRQRLTLGKALSLRIPNLELVEQGAIADYLDAETARIDALIVKKQQLIHLLEERREGLAMDAIRGGSVAGPRAPSGMPWLGTIPANWEMPPIYARYDVLLGRMLNAERATGGDQRPYLRNINVRWLDVNLEDVATMDFPEGERARYLLKPGDLLICEGGAGYARAAVWDGRVAEMYFQKSLHRVRPRGPWPVRWLAEFLRAGKAAGAFEAGGNLATIPHLTAEQLRAYRVPMPPTPAEAQAILDRVDRQAENLARTAVSIERQLALLAEHRQALISAAVQGHSHG